MVTLIPIPLCLPLGQEATEVRFGPGDGPALEWTEQRYADAYTGIGISPNIEVGDPGFGPFFWQSSFGRRDVSVGSAPEPDRKKVHHRSSGGSI